jgi:hypothetical protein
MQHTVAFKLELELYEAFMSFVKDERERNEIKAPVGQIVRKIVMAHLRAKGYLSTDKPKARQKQENGEKSLFDGESEKSEGA